MKEETLLQLGGLYSKGRCLTSVILRVYYTHSFFLNMFGITCLSQDAKSKNISYWILNFSSLSKVAVNIPQLLQILFIVVHICDMMCRNLSQFSVSNISFEFLQTPA